MHKECRAAINFRMAESSDIQSLADLRWRLGTDDMPECAPSARQAFIEKFCSSLPEIENRERIAHFVAQTSEQIVAVMSIVRVTKIPSHDSINGAWGYLTNVYTLPEFRNKGIGSSLLAEAQGWARSQQMELLMVWPSDASYPFYERFGFRREQDPLVLKIIG